MHLTIERVNEGGAAVTPCMLLDDLAPCVHKHHQRNPKTRFTFFEMQDDEVPGAVLERQANFGFTPTPLTGGQLGLLCSAPPNPDLHERPMRGCFGDITDSLVRRRGGHILSAGEAFIRVVRQELGSSLSERK